MQTILRDPRSKTALWRLGFRGLVILAFGTLWPGPNVGIATATLCVGLALGCLVSAIARREPFYGSGLNHWLEAAALVIVAGVAVLMR